jgi:exopolysaccharide biosynthesis polyprenyl glycosylphosphotransferase
MFRHSVERMPIAAARAAHSGTARGGALFLKGAMDCLGAALALVLLAPILLTIAILIRLEDGGPVLYRQTRSGLDHRPFEILKFRTMRPGAAEPGRRDRLAQARPGDARVTRIGRWLRRYSLDELPQLLNVLRGQMSLVGPRPHAVAHDEHYAALIPGYAARRRVKPGITGWAQIAGLRGETREVGQMAARVAHDLWYIEHWSLGLDLRILLRTLAGGFLGPNAY